MAGAKHLEKAKEVVNEWISPEAEKAALAVSSGIPYVNGVDADAIGIIADAKAIIEEGHVGPQIESLTKYTKGSLKLYIQDMLVGNREAKGVLAEPDNHFKNQAIDANDPNWASER